jgi:hypothetical protein
MTRDAKDEDWIRSDVMMNDKTRRSMNGFTVAQTAKPTNLPRGSFSEKGEQFTMRRGDLSVVRILWTNETKCGIQDTHDQPNVEYQEKRAARRVLSSD